MTRAKSLRLGAAIVASALVSSGAHPVQRRAVPPPAPPRLYDFKGVTLGISLDEFRNVPHPDGKQTMVVCTGEKISVPYASEPTDVMVFDSDEEGAGVRKCVWVNASTAPYSFPGSIEPLRLADTEYVCTSYNFSFIPDPLDKVLRLFKIKCKSNADAMPSVVAALTTKYGPPSTVTGKVQNKIGNSFEQTTAIWNNPLSSLVVQDRFATIDDMVILVTDNRLSDVLDKYKKDQASKIQHPI